MRIDKIRFRNFASYGNKDQEIDLTGPPAFYQIVGQNGAGKTTISDAIKFVSYGKVDKKSLKDLANRTNKHAWVALDAFTKNKKVSVERTINPSGMSLSVDGIPYDKSRYEGKGASEYLTDELLDIPYYVFSNIISLSINDFKSFMTMGAKDKREIVDRVLGYQIINDMRTLLSKESSSLTRTIDEYSGKLDGARRNLSSSMDELDALARKLQENTDEKSKLLNEQLTKFRQLLEIHSKKLEEFRDREKQLNEEIQKYQGLLATAKGNMDYASRRLDLYRSNQCPTCGGSLETDHHITIKQGLETDYNNAKADFEKYRAEAESIRSRKSEMDRERDDLMSKGSKIQSGINEASNHLRQLQFTGNDQQTESIRNLIARIESEIQEWTKTKSQNESKLAWIKVMEESVGENGIKRIAMQRIIPAFNSEIYNMMLQMHLDYTVTFDENFDATLMHLGEEISPATLSFGESKKVDFVILIAWIRLMKMKYPTMNLLFLDEIFSSVDQDGIHSILQILHKVCQELQMNIFVISHNPLPQEVFDYRIEIEKKDGFSNLRVEKA